MLTLAIITLVLNFLAVGGGAVVWKLYFDQLKATIATKEAEVSLAEKRRDEWKERAEELEKRAPEVVEKVLADRIQIREGEIARLASDSALHQTEIAELQREKGVLEADLVRAQGFRLMLAMEDAADEEYEPEHPASATPQLSPELESLLFPDPDAVEIELVYLGEVGVDSGQLLVTDPCYIDGQWKNEPYSRIGPDESPEMMKERRALMPYSYDGACHASLRGGGELAFARGHAGAGVAFSTGWGDGIFPVYAEKHDGRTVRVFINV